jgi:hypothetical protein
VPSRTTTKELAMNSPDSHKGTVNSIEDLLDLIPYLLGFVPQNSMVMVGIAADDNVRHLARLDLHTPDSQWETELGKATRALAGDGAKRIMLVGYGHQQPVHERLNAARQAARASGIQTIGAVRVMGEHYWPLTGPALRAPAEATPYEPGTSSVAAAAVYAGLVALPDRAALVATLAPATGDERERMTAATDHAAQAFNPLIAIATGDDNHPGTLHHALHNIGSKLLTQIEQRYQRRQTADDGQAAVLSVLLTLPSLRDTAGSRTGSEDWQRSMWTDLVRRAEPRYAAAPATLLALCALHDGSGVLAGIAIERALEADPGNPMARLIAEAISLGVAPEDITGPFRRDQN